MWQGWYSGTAYDVCSIGVVKGRAGHNDTVWGTDGKGIHEVNHRTKQAELGMR